MDSKFIVYQTVCTVNNKIYVGVHESTSDKFDGYIGCGVFINSPSTYKNPKTAFQYAVKKYGPKKFIRTTIAEFDNEKDAYALEGKLVNEEFISREDVYNLALGGTMGYRKENNPRKKEVHMYSLDGEYIRSFESVNEAGRFLNPNARGAGHLPRAIKLGHQYLGYQFSYEKVPFMKKLNAMKNRLTVEKPYVGKKVARCNNDWEVLQIYDTMTDCVKDGYKNAKQVALGKRNFCKGFRFKYLD